jgi:hypothetical protein
VIKRVKAVQWNFDFCLLLGILVLANLFYFRPAFIPVGDTMHVFCMFYFFYNEFFTHGHLAQWMPFSAFGVPSLLPQVAGITPVRYAVGLFAVMLQIREVLAVWKFTVLLEQMVFLLGLYLLSRVLYSRRSAVFFVCLGGILSTFWWEQIFFGFHVFYLLPLVLYLMLMFLKKGRPEYFWMAGLAAISAFVGVTPYAAGLWLFIFLIILAALSWRHRDSWARLLVPRRANIVLAVLFFGMAAVYVYAVCAQSRGVEILSGGRDPHTGKCLLSDFLQHGGLVSPGAVLRAFVTGDVRHKVGDVGNLAYIGLLPLVFFLWAVARVRNTIYYALLVITAALTALSFGGIAARILYHFPLVGYYRHLGYLYGLIKVFILLCAGFGWEHFFDHAGGKKRTAGLLVVSALFLGMVLGKSFVFPGWAFGLAVVFAAGMAGWWFFGRRGSGDRQGAVLAVILLVVFAVDMGFYQLRLYRMSTTVPVKDRSCLESVLVHRQEYVPQRTFLVPPGGRAELAMGLLNTPEPLDRTYYSWENAFVQRDRCIPAWTMQMAAPGVGRINAVNPVLFAVVGGCLEPKLRLFSGSEYVSPDQEKSLFLKMDGLLKKIVGRDRNRVSGAMTFVHQLLKDKIFIRRESGVALPPEGAERLPSDAIGRVAVLRYDTDEIVADVDVRRGQGAWLMDAEAFHPDWHAVVDGEPARLFVADGVFKALYLPEGAHRVRLFFDQGPVRAARYVLALFGVCAALAYGALFMRTCFRES